MDKIVTYEYGVGSPEQIRKGTVLRKDVTCGVQDDLVLFDTAIPGIIRPIFIGVYQTERLVIQGNKEQEAADVLMHVFNYKKTQFDNAIQIALENMECQDTLHPDLISVLYNNQWSEELAKKSIGDMVGRISFCGMDSMPEYYEKDLGNFYVLVDQFIEAYQQGCLSKTLKQLHNQLHQLSIQMQQYGQTRTEYVLFELLYMRLLDGEG